MCQISYMPYRLGYPDGVPEGAVEVGSLAELVDPAALPYESRTAVGPLQNGTAICGGFSWAFQMLCEEAGISCWNVTGTGAGEEHMWNCALLDGEYRYFDTTWDAGCQDERQWRYFARTEDEISQDHFWGIGQQDLMHGLTR